MSNDVRSATPILKLLVVCTFFIASALIGAGILLMYLGGQGITEITFFGNTFKSANVGVVGVFLGAVLAIAAVSRTLKAVERLARM
jgi:hypothetical protein